MFQFCHKMKKVTFFPRGGAYFEIGRKTKKKNTKEINEIGREESCFQALVVEISGLLTEDTHPD